MKISIEAREDNSGLDVKFSLTECQSLALAHLFEDLSKNTAALLSSNYMDVVVAQADEFAKEQYKNGDRSMPSSYSDNYKEEAILWFTSHPNYPGNATQRRLAEEEAEAEKQRIKQEDAQKAEDEGRALLSELDNEEAELLSDE